MMWTDSLEKAVYSAITYIRKVQHKRLPGVNIIETVAQKCDQKESKIEKHLDHFVETRAVLITFTEKVDSYFTFDTGNIGVEEDDPQILLMDDVSTHWNLESTKKLHESSRDFNKECY